jgi:hypothetical protein
MEKDQTIPENHPSGLSYKSFSVAFEQMAQLLRSEVKMKDRATKVLSSNALSVSFTNSFKQIAKLLRSEARPSKKRSWTKHSSKRKDRSIH